METLSTPRLPSLLSWLQPRDFPHKLGLCERLFGAALQKHGVCWVQTGAGLPWKLDLTNATHRWMVYGKYEEAALLNWAKTFLPPDGIVVDAGANIGQMLLYLAPCVPQGRVFAFEPGHLAADWLQACLDRHPHLPVELWRFGLGPSRGQKRLRHNGPVSIHGAWDETSETEGDPIEIVSLPEILNQRSVSHVDLWQMDIQGDELAALQGAEEWLRQKRIKALWVEIGDPKDQTVSQYLASLGYRGYHVKSSGALIPYKPRDGVANVLFLPAH